jgi:hypothetical protein
LAIVAISRGSTTGSGGRRMFVSRPARNPSRSMNRLVMKNPHLTQHGHYQDEVAAS